MFHKAIIRNNTSRYQRGSALVIAVFIIVVITLLGTGLVRMQSAGSETVVYEVLGTRAYQAAQVGMQRKLAKLFPLAPAGENCDGAEPYDFSTIQGLENCRAIDVACTESTVSNVTHYTIRSTGTCDVAGVVTQRVLEVSARKL